MMEIGGTGALVHHGVGSLSTTVQFHGLNSGHQAYVASSFTQQVTLLAPNNNTLERDNIV